ncbi:hypothetical protein [Chryseobacterium gallinarum]|uniref:DUF1801 domain-containing protein n=1 Tax=Chryseobacterium gallinarum TaxID=1324352 RepID=A0A0G3M1L4_CHRGL|nr:hypothetical protein [Chryseobacterium gallinarum]AKK72774.1 hypothetical protein OK18_09190 [Chryseobacterium gallinarum]MCL8536389.1 DUF1801 domain-containing protein [Chryseobacterium gallinarum]QIY91485.1 DUF1801 domain-containing protein [Chryseobacterium gallinarum]
MNPIQEYFYRIEEPERSTLLFLRKAILDSDRENITETLSFGLPFIKYKKKMLCYFYYSKKYKKHYLSFYHGDKLDYPELIQDGRKKFKILLIDVEEDLPVKFILSLLDEIKPYIK